ncbi:MAG: alpha/beta hydrolase [Anaerolineae bacterium]
MLSRILKWCGAASLVALGAGLLAFSRDRKRAYERVRARGTILPSPYGAIEYTDGGSGPDVLVVHGSGGGYDQGELIVQAVLGDRFHWIAPSRFGYLGSALPAGATWDDQAHAFAYLLDHLGLARVAVVALSQGGPSALLFAVLHPERVSSLSLISCGVVASADTDQAGANAKGRILRLIYRSDLIYWAISTLFKRQFMGLMGATRAVVAGLTSEQRRLAERVIDDMNPASLRAAGVVFDNEAQLPGARIAAIEAPTLIFHARDDTLQLYHNADFAASTIPGARLMSFEHGGHLVLAVEQSRIEAGVREHILSHQR